MKNQQNYTQYIYTLYQLNELMKTTVVFQKRYNYVVIYLCYNKLYAVYFM